MIYVEFTMNDSFKRESDSHSDSGVDMNDEFQHLLTELYVPH